MKVVAALIFAALLLSGCVAASEGAITHEDTPAGRSQSDGAPTLCHDGTPPPCTIRN